MFLKCDAHANTLKRHLRGFLMVRDPAGKRLVFRYYDPRVLRVYLPTCVDEELQSFFGPIGCFWTEGKAEQNMLEFRLHRGNLVQRTLSLAQASERAVSPASETAPPDALPRHGLLAIRQEQMAAFSRAELEKFEARTLARLLQSFPKQCGTLTESQLRNLIQYGIRRARTYRITSERDVSQYIDLMLRFGQDFDTDPRCAWAGYILANRKTARSKLRGLHEAAPAHTGQ
jgi:hypothetical protein